VTIEDVSVLRLGAAASVAQSALFVVIGAAALVLGINRFVREGFGSLMSAEPAAFRVMCAAFILIAVLGLAITPAEQALVEAGNPGLARFGAALAYLGHAGTIGFFSWWLLASLRDDAAAGLGRVAPIAWGVMFELVFVGAWVWIILGVGRSQPILPRGFLALSAVKAVSFWFTFAAVVVNDKWMIVLGLGAVAFVTGPSWHLWVARIMVRRVAEPNSAR
jgi:hypothetical protein